ncbi:radical SAM/SPASM domain-containing protein [Longimicrobium sp.]|uniref:radical SAM/SPASM domain-containing protein n=1 Tax=Longimicrobium sp. TaxID=2029185 RepID=UPI002B51439D|nr:radical SAM protein [Longimicrobium sp.]HSU15720.1 radical SAM protein [Longimicrobium sp.]
MTPTTDMFESPHDRNGTALATTSLVQLRYKAAQRWVPSRYNARAVGDDGRLMLWNTLNGTISVFAPKDRDRVLEALSVEGVREPLGKAGEYLTRRGYLVREGVNELDIFRYRYANDQWRQDTLQLILLASEDCNFRCVYCYEKFERGTMTPETRQGIKALLDQRAPRLKEFSVSWFGGEPLYGWDAVSDLSPYFRKTCDEHGIRYGQHMTTNAYLLTEERATHLLEWGCRNFQITLDGLAEEHDCKRVGRDGSGTFSTILDNLRSLRERRGEEFGVDLRVNFDRSNFPKLGPFLEAMSEEFGGDTRFRMRFRAVGKWGGANDANLDTCGTTDSRTYMRELQERAKQLQLGQEAGIREIATLGSQVCYAARPFNLIVGATGQLMKCTIALYDMPENRVGQLHPDGSLELDDLNMSKWVNPHFETDAMCQSCHVLPGCQGGHCPLSRVTSGTRTCCTVKSNLKREMRFTMADMAEAAAARAAEPQPV